MLDNCTIQERWNGVNELIERWLQARQTIIVQFCNLSGIHEQRKETDSPSQRLQTFCEHLVDYLSAGHFEVYYELIREAEAFADGSAEQAKALLPGISATTQKAMAFNDQYIDAEGLLDGLPASLSELGEILEARFELEDQLIDTLHESHRDKVQVA